jgi:hypothetical protein
MLPRNGVDDVKSSDMPNFYTFLAMKGRFAETAEELINSGIIGKYLSCLHRID